MKQAKKVVLYPRVSSQKQLSNDSLPTQRREMERFADEQEYEVVRTFEEAGRSAKNTNRPALQDMLRWISDHPGEIYAVLVLTYDRAARSVQDHLAIRAMLASQNVRLISTTEPVTDDPHGKFMEVIIAGMAELNNTVRGDRSKLGMVNATKRGRWVYQAPVGYLNRGKNASPSLGPYPATCELVREAFTRVATGESPVAVYADLVARGFRSRRGRPVGRQTFYRMLHNPVYKAELDTKLGVGPGDWEPLLETGVWEKVQSVLSHSQLREAPAAPSSRSRKRSYRRVRQGFELRGFLICATCSRKITGGMTKGLRYMNCPEGHVRARAEVLNSRFCQWLALVRPNEMFLRRLEREVRRELEAEQRSLSHRRSQKQRAAAKIEANLQNLNRALANGTMEADAYKVTYRELKVALQALKHGGVEVELEQLDVEAVLNFAQRLLSQPERWWGQASPEDKIRLQRALFPDGLLVDEALQFSTDLTSNESVAYMLFGGRTDDMASPTGTNTLWKGTSRGTVRAA